MNDYQAHFEKLEELYARVYVAQLFVADETLDRYATLKLKSRELHESLADSTKYWREFEKGHAKLVMALAALDANLTRLQHAAEGSKRDDVDGAEQLAVCMRVRRVLGCARNGRRSFVISKNYLKKIFLSFLSKYCSEKIFSVFLRENCPRENIFH